MMLWTLIALSTAAEFRVATLNIGHGRGTGVHQTLQTSGKVHSNIDTIGESLASYELDVLALQESDTSAWWSGNRDQVQSLSTILMMEHTLSGFHSKKSRLEYGTSLISRSAIQETQSIGYRSSFPLPPKGFVMGVVSIDGHRVVVVSIHLDPRRSSVRKRQVAVLHEVIAPLELPLIVMGDFNVEWGEELQEYCDLLSVKPYAPSQEFISYPKHNRRLDWILISDGLTFEQYVTESTFISDHRLVVSTIQVSSSAEKEPPRD